MRGRAPRAIVAGYDQGHVKLLRMPELPTPEEEVLTD
jgi:hypothetical protein